MKNSILVLLVACAPMAPFQPTTVSAPPDAFARAVRSLTDMSETIETKDEAAGLIVTKWELSETMGTKFRMRWKITIENGAATVDSQCQEKITDTTFNDDSWSNCGNQASNRSDKAKAIAAKIGQ